jgi:hypothetical protein
MDVSRRKFVGGLAVAPFAGIFGRLLRGTSIPEESIEVAEIVEDLVEETRTIEHTSDGLYFLRSRIMDFPKIRDGDTYNCQLEIQDAEFVGNGYVEQVAPKIVRFRSWPTEGENRLTGLYRRRYYSNGAIFGGKLKLSLIVPKSADAKAEA